MQKFQITTNSFLDKDVQAYCHLNYLGYKKPGNPDYINTLKNTYNNTPAPILINAVTELIYALNIDLPQILYEANKNPLYVCVVPRAKTKYQPNQLLVKAAVQNVVNKIDGFVDATNYILRHTDTRTTHLPQNTPNYVNNGALPYPGITKATCVMSGDINNKDILLIDDLYTKTVNIDEDAIQALFDSGARTVIFYAIGKTILR